MNLKYNYTNLLKNDYMQNGISFEEIELNRNKVENAHQLISEYRQKNILGFYDSPDFDTTKIKSYVKTIQEKFDTIVVLGIGGSALGNKAVYSALKNSRKLKKQVITLDNVDPHLLAQTLNQIDINRTLFNVITKSGTTIETMSTFLIILDILKKKLPNSYKDQIVVTTDEHKGLMRKIVAEEKYERFVVPDNVGGRFSVLTDVGLLSSAFAGIDIDLLLKGAANMRSKCLNSDIYSNPAYLNGLIHYLYLLQGKTISVMMPYSNDLYDLADWYRQLWAESLGKKYDLRKNEVFTGQTPVKALGTTDQHSQVQLYTEGPNDKVFTFLSVENFYIDYNIPNLYPEIEDLSFLGNKKLSSLLNAERIGTEVALTKAQRPNCNLILPELNEFNLGEFIFMYEVQTVFAGFLLNINPLDQPGVEEGKIAACALMGKKNYQKQSNELNDYNIYQKENGRII